MGRQQWPCLDQMDLFERKVYLCGERTRHPLCQFEAADVYHRKVLYCTQLLNLLPDLGECTFIGARQPV